MLANLILISGLGMATISAEEEVPWGVEAIGAPEVWEHSMGNREVIVAIIDTGVDYLHPDLEATIWNNTDEVLNGLDDDNNGYVDDIRGWNFFDENNDPMDLFPSSHGTHVAGVVAGSLNGFGVVGVAPNVTIMPLKVFGSSTTEGARGLAAAIRYATQNGASIISMSLGSAGVDTSIRTAIEEAWETGLLLVSATGNSGGSFVDFPAALPEVIAVSALRENLTYAEFSNRGPLNEISAPGVRINSTVRHNASFESNLEVNSTIYRSNWVVNASEVPVSGLLAFGGLGRSEELESVVGRLVLLERGGLTLSEKIANVQEAGGIGVIISNDLPGRFYGQLNESAALPAVSISKADGELLKTLLDRNLSLVVDLEVKRVSYKLLSGTSMAVPHVSGVAALIWSLNGSLSNEEVRMILDRSTIDAGSTGPDDNYGYGVLNALRALKLIQDSSFPYLNYAIGARWNEKRSRIELEISFSASDDMGVFSVEVEAENGSGIILNAPIQYNQARDAHFSGNVSLAYPSYLGNMTIRIRVEDLRGHSLEREALTEVFLFHDALPTISETIISQMVTITQTQSSSTSAGFLFIFILIFLTSSHRKKQKSL